MTLTDTCTSRWKSAIPRLHFAHSHRSLFYTELNVNYGNSLCSPLQCNHCFQSDQYELSRSEVKYQLTREEAYIPPSLALPRVCKWQEHRKSVLVLGHNSSSWPMQLCTSSILSRSPLNQLNGREREGAANKGVLKRQPMACPMGPEPRPPGQKKDPVPTETTSELPPIIKWEAGNTRGLPSLDGR